MVNRNEFIQYSSVCRCSTGIWFVIIWKLIFTVVRANNLPLTPNTYEAGFVCLVSTVPTAAADSFQTESSNRTTTRNLGSMFSHNRDALIRSTYLFGGLCLLALIYFGFRSLRLSRRKSGKRTGTRKYLPLSTGGRDVQELVPFDGDDEDEDTLFDTSQPSTLTN